MATPPFLSNPRCPSCQGMQTKTTVRIVSEQLLAFSCQQCGASFEQMLTWVPKPTPAAHVPPAGDPTGVPVVPQPVTGSLTHPGPFTLPPPPKPSRYRGLALSDTDSAIAVLVNLVECHAHQHLPTQRAPGCSVCQGLQKAVGY